ncbi:phage baseplate assembly protein V [Paenibacillus sp. UNC451MF]|uniref:phage baseplate assembly protein V n=1 Tax=Paenibacillus sp. UNC451MF TaxID=1449063 RepID=UPI00048D5CA6|nr:phage baseplate assembly protein V [Paenibacillus sp. UNC451MF]
MSDWRNLIRVGLVSSVNREAGTARVTFPDKTDQVTADLPVLVPTTQQAHYITFPQVGETAVCLFLGNGIQTGFILGALYTDQNPPPAVEPSAHGVWFPDGSHVYYDPTAGTLHLKASSHVHIEGNLVVTGTVTQGGS